MSSKNTATPSAISTLPSGLAAAAVPLVLFLVIPIVALLASVQPHEWITRLQDADALSALILSVRTTLLAATLCAIFGLPVAFLLARFDFLGRDVVDTLVDLPITVPPVVVGLGLLLAFGRMGLVGRHLHAIGVDIGFTTAAVVMAQVTIAAPFFVKTARAGFESVDTGFESAARVLGANRWRTFWTVTFPLAAPSLMAALLLAWARALSEFGATMMFAGNFAGKTQTLPLAVMAAFDSDVSSATAIATVSLALSAFSLILAKVLMKRWRLDW